MAGEQRIRDAHPSLTMFLDAIVSWYLQLEIGSSKRAIGQDFCKTDTEF